MARDAHAHSHRYSFAHNRTNSRRAQIAKVRLSNACGFASIRPWNPKIHYRLSARPSENVLIRLFAFATSFERWPHVRSFGACRSSHRRKALSNHLPPASPASSSIQICENPSDAQLPPWRVSRLRVGAQNQSRPAGCVSRSVSADGVGGGAMDSHKCASFPAWLRGLLLRISLASFSE